MGSSSLDCKIATIESGQWQWAMRYEEKDTHTGSGWLGPKQRERSGQVVATPITRPTYDLAEHLSLFAAAFSSRV